MSLQQRYSHHANRALSHAQTLAAGFQHPAQDTAHLLVGVILAEGSIGAQVLSDFGLTVAVAGVYLKRLMEHVERDEPPPPSPALLLALQQAEEESDWLGQHYIGTEHLLLGFTRNNVGNAIDLLRLLDVTAEQVRRRVRRAISDGQREFSLESIRTNARLSEVARRVLNRAEALSVQQSHPTVSFGHLLLALAQEQRVAPAAILRQGGLDMERLASLLAHQHPSLMLSIEPLLEEAVNLAEKLGSHYVGADHLLLTLASLPAGQAALLDCGAAADKVYRLLNRTFNPPPPLLQE